VTPVEIVIAFVTVLIALTGAVLGIINTVHRIRREGVMLRVTPKFVKVACDWAAVNLRVQVINHSSFPVTIVDVGLVFKNRKREDESIVHYPRFETDPEPRIPVKLKAKEIFEWDHPLGPWDTYDNVNYSSIKHAYVKTEFGDRICGKSRKFRQMCRKFKRFSQGKKNPLPKILQPEG